MPGNVEVADPAELPEDDELYVRRLRVHHERIEHSCLEKVLVRIAK